MSSIVRTVPFNPHSYLANPTGLQANQIPGIQNQWVGKEKSLEQPIAWTFIPLPFKVQPDDNLAMIMNFERLDGQQCDNGQYQARVRSI